MIFTGALFFGGGNILLVIFALTLAQVFLVLGAYSANSPYSHIGAERELLQIMAYEPMVIIAAVAIFCGLGLALGSNVDDPGGGHFAGDRKVTGVLLAVARISGVEEMLQKGV